MKSGMALKKREFMPESGNVDTYEIIYVMFCHNEHLLVGIIPSICNMVQNQLKTFGVRLHSGIYLHL